MVWQSFFFLSRLLPLLLRFCHSIVHEWTFKYWHFICFEIRTVQFAWPAYHQCDSTTSEGNPDLNYQPFTVFIVYVLAVPQSSKCIQILRVQLWISKKCSWLDLLIQSKYRSVFLHHKAVILQCLAIVCLGTRATTAVSQGFAADESFLVSVRNQG